MLPRLRLIGHAGLKHRLVNVDAVPVLIRSACKQRCFIQLICILSVYGVSQFLKIRSYC